MLLQAQPGFDYYSWIILPLLIFASRICDVSFGTLRHVFVARGIRNLAPIVGFFEVLIWIIVVKQVMTGANNWACYIAWAGGFAAGSYIGLGIEERLAIGLQVVRIITNQDCTELQKALSQADHGITVVDAQGSKGPVKMIFSVVKRKNVPDVELLILKHNPTAFYSVEDIKDINHGIFSARKKKVNYARLLFPIRK
jgi:uncharacterized protein YebE (UPF0316 family)